MPNTHISRYWLVAALWFLMYIEVGQSDDDAINLDDLPLTDYITELKLIEPKSLSGWYKMTNGFLSAVHSKSSETLDILLQYSKEKKIEFHHFLYELLKVQYAMFACVIIGLLFAVTMFITGLIFFCCRMCGNCGGKRVQVITSSTSILRKIYILSLIVLVALILPAVITLFIINGSLNTSFVETEKTIYSSLYDAEIFVNNTKNQVAFLTFNGVNKAVNGLTQKINDVQAFIERKMQGLDMTEKLKEAEPALLGWLNVSMGVDLAANFTKKLAFETSNIVESLTELREELKSRKSKCTDEDCKKIEPTVFTLDDSVIGDVEKNLSETRINLEVLNEDDYKKILFDIVKSVKAIPSQITVETASIRKEVIGDLNDFGKEVLTSEHLKQLENFTDLARDMIQKTQQEAKKRFPDARNYDKSRWYGGLVVGIVIAVVIGGLFLGLFFGICGYRHDRQATKRTTSSNGAGLILMFIVYWMFLFSGLLMLLTTVLFVVGGIVETFVCRPLFDENFKALDQVMDIVKQNPALNTSSIIEGIVPSVALRKCAKNETVYEAFNLERLNISSMLDYEKKLKLDQRSAELQKIPLPQPKFITPHAESAFEALFNALDINMTKEIERLRESSVDGFEEQVEILMNITDSTVKEILPAVLTISAHVKMLQEQMEVLAQILQKISDGSSQLLAGAYKTKNFFIQSEAALAFVIREMHKKSITEFVEELKAYGDRIIQSVLENFEKKLAPCGPLWNIFNSSRTVVCKYYVQPLNGIWFAVGWSLFFFIPTVIISTKLSKHFFKMNYVATGEKDEKSDYDMELTNGYKIKPDEGWHSPSHRL